MKRTLFTMLLVLTAAVTWAQRWTAKTSNDFDGESVVYVTLKLNGEAITVNGAGAIELAAFIGDECRADATGFYYPETGGEPNCYRLRVVGDRTKDDGADIVFKAAYRGLVYKFAAKQAWQANGTIGEPSNPLVLELETITGIEVENPITVTKGESIADLTTKIKGWCYGNATTAGASTVSPVDTDETALEPVTYTYDFGNSAAFINVEGNKLTGLESTANFPEGVYLGITAAVKDATGADLLSVSGYTNVIVTEVVATAISSDITELTAYVNDNLKELLSGHVTITPAEASQEYNIASTPEGAFNDNNILQTAGEYTLSLTPTTGSDITPAQIKLTVKVRPETIAASTETVTVNVGENAVNAIKSVITLRPQIDGLDDALTITPEDATLYNSTSGIAEKVGETNVTITPNAALPANGAVPSVTIKLIVKKAVTAITLNTTDVTLHVGDNVKDALKVTFTPEDATNQDYDIRELTQAGLIEKGIATKAGETTISVVSADDPSVESATTAKVTVLEWPTSISGPEPLYVNIGENVYKKILENLTFTPDGDYVDKSVRFFDSAKEPCWGADSIATKEGEVLVTVISNNPSDAAVISCNITVIISKPAIPVTAIELKGDPITVYLGDDLYNPLAEQVTYSPDDADEDYKYFWLVPVVPEDIEKISDNIANAPGVVEVKVATSGANQEEIVSTKSVQVTVMVRPNYINVPNDAVEVNVGANVLDAITNAITIGNSDWDADELAAPYIDKSFTIALATDGKKTYYDEEYIATTVTDDPIAILVTTNGESADGGPLTQIVYLKIKQPVTGLNATQTEFDFTVGDEVFNQIMELAQITVTPADATNQGYSLVPAEGSEEAFSDGMAVKAGKWYIDVVSDDDPNVTLRLTINVIEPIVLNFDPELNVAVGETVTLTLTKVAGSGDVDPSLVSISFQTTGEGIPVATATVDETGLVWTVTGVVPGNFSFNVYYDGVMQYTNTNVDHGMLYISQVVAPTEGWDWITVNTLPAESSSIVLRNATNNAWRTEMGTANSDNKVIEIRSQSALLYNDPTYGFFGDITELKPGDGMYKIKTQGTVKFDLGTDVTAITANSLPTIVKGYTWVGYPHQVDQPLSNLADALAKTAQNGDMIIGKDAFAEFNGTSWISSGFTFKAGKGYMYYTEGNGGQKLDWGTPSYTTPMVNPADGDIMPEDDYYGNAREMGGMNWSYDASQFADNMPIVAVLDGIDNPEDYSIGAFVGNECRGEGKLADGKYMFINVAGKSGETVSFRLYDKQTGKTTMLGETVPYGGKVGSLRNPMLMSANTTGIRSISAAAEGTTITVTNASGKVVRVSANGSVSLDNLPSGVYIVTETNGTQRTSKKIIK